MTPDPHAGWTATTRVLCGASLLAAIGIPLVLHARRAADAELGTVRLAEARSLGLEGAQSTTIDLTAAERRPRDPSSRKVPVPDWRAGRTPAVRLFVDGEPAPVAGYEGGLLPTARADGYFYATPAGGRKQLAVRCHDATPCREAVVFHDGPAFALRLTGSRLQRTGLALPLMAGLVVAAGMAVFAAARVRRPLAAAVAAWFLVVVWIAARLDLWPWSDRLILALGAALAAPFAGFVGRRIGAVLSGRVGTAARPFTVWFAGTADRWAPWVSAALCASLLVPMASRGRAFFMEWSNNLYYVARQAESWKELGRPSYFLHTDLSGVFYPYYLFYGGTLYAFTGGLAALLGSPFAAYIALFGLGFAMAWTGFYWLGRQCSLSRAEAAAAPLVAVTSAYYLANAYARGTWHEFVATSAVPLVAASALALARSADHRRRSGGVLLAAVVLLTGSHTITLLWGATFLGVSAVAALWAVGWRRVAPSPAARVAVAAGGLIALGVNGWFLVPALAYASYTHIGGYAAHGFGSDCWYFNLPGVLFHPGRFTPPQSSTPGLYVQVSIYALAWALAVVWARWGPESRAARRSWIALLGLLFAFLILILRDPWPLVPRVFKIIQFQFRLNTWVAWLVAALVMAGLLAVRRSSRRAAWTAALLGALGLQVALAQYQVWTAPTYFSLAAIVDAGTAGPPSLSEAWDYRFLTRPRRREGREPVFFPDPTVHGGVDPASVRRDKARVLVPENAGDEPFVVNLAWSPFVEAEGGAVIAGRTRDGWAVLRRRPGAPVPAVATLRLHRDPFMIAGWAVSLLALAAAVGWLWIAGGIRDPATPLPRTASDRT